MEPRFNTNRNDRAKQKAKIGSKGSGRISTSSFMPFIAVVCLIIAVAVGVGTGVRPAYAAPGDLDPTFDGDGLAIANVPDGHAWGNDMALQADGKIVVAGFVGPNYNMTSNNFAAARFNSDGSLDTSFGGTGTVVTDFNGNADEAYGVAVQSDGKIVVVGFDTNGANSRDFALVRYNGDGSLDTSFDGDGKVTTDFFGGTDSAYGVAIEPDGQIVVVGYASFSYVQFALARYNSDGSLDTSFDGDGKVTTSYSAYNDLGNAVAIQSDGKIIAAGYAGSGSGNTTFAAGRYNSNGNLDTSFDGDGKVTTDFSSRPDQGTAVTLQADGKIVVAGNVFILNSNNNQGFGLVRYNSDGSLDTGFDGDGRVITEITTNNSSADGVAIDADGKIVAAGWTYMGGNDSHFVVTRYLTDGALDTSFSSDGIVTTNFGPATDNGHAIVIQPDSKIVVAGQAFITGSGSTLSFGVARYLSGGEPTPTATPTPCVPGSFSDVPPDHTFYPFISCLVDRGVISGYSDCTFRPSNLITRGQIAKVVSNGAGFADDVTGRHTYADVPADNAFWTWVERLSIHNVMGGYDCGGEGEPCDDQNRPYFRWAANATRGQLSKIVSNAAGYSDNPPDQLFTDVAASNTFYVWVQRLASRGIMGGYSCGGEGEPCDGQNRPYFRPYNNVTRGQASKIVANTFFSDCQTR
jgi:uncharacterized delta-60 repeat protein